MVSKLNENLLREIASAGAGIYVRANNSKAGLATLLEEINKMEKKVKKFGFNNATENITNIIMKMVQ